MPKNRYGFVASVLISLVLAMAPVPSTAQENCELYDTTVEIVDVFKTPSAQGKYFELLERGDVTCISKQQKSGNQTWGFVTYRKESSGRKVAVNGWVDLQFVARQGSPKPAAVTPKQTVTEAQPGPEAAEKSTKAEVAYWDTVRDSRDPDLIKLYLENYPNGAFADLARAMIAKLQQGTVASPTTKRAKAYVPPSTKATRKSTAKKKKRKKTARAKVRSEQSKKKKRATNAKKKSSEPRVSRRPRKKCRYETKFECMRRGGQVNDVQECNVKWICK